MGFNTNDHRSWNVMSDHDVENRLIQMKPILFGIAGRVFSCYADRQDAVQVCLCRAWQFRKNVKNPDSFEVWLVRVMKNVCVDMCRKNAQCVPLIEGTPAIADGGDAMCRWIEADALYGALRALPAERRAIVCGHFIEGRTLRELSEMSGVCMGCRTTIHLGHREKKRIEGCSRICYHDAAKPMTERRLHPP